MEESVKYYTIMHTYYYFCQVNLPKVLASYQGYVNTLIRSSSNILFLRAFAKTEEA